MCVLHFFFINCFLWLNKGVSKIDRVIRGVWKVVKVKGQRNNIAPNFDAYGSKYSKFVGYMNTHILCDVVNSPHTI